MVRFLIYLHQLCVLIVGNKEDLLLGMKENYIKENVMQLEKI